jgi:hypothetical protein
MNFTVCALFYGAHTPLARRCLDSIMASATSKHVKEIRIGLNSVSDETRNYVFTTVARLPIPCHIYEPTEHRNVFKYPLMRQMFYDAERPITTPYIMWFDDDSCITTPSEQWFNGVAGHMGRADMMGDLWYYPFQGDTAKGVQAQAWYTGKPWKKFRGKPAIHFVTGGWWSAKTEIIKKWDYPFPELIHNGGDTLLGEMMRQQGYIVKDFKEGLWINADETGKRSSAKRRGASHMRLWYDYAPGRVPDMKHYDFEMKVSTLA